MAIIDTLKLARALHDKGGFCPIAASIFGLKIGGVGWKTDTRSNKPAPTTQHQYLARLRLQLPLEFV